MPTALASVLSQPRELVAADQTAARARAANANAPVFVMPVKTELTTEQASALLSSAYQRVTGEAPTAECTALLTAQWAHETGRGGSMYNYNFGGIKGASAEGHSVLCKTKEGWGASEVRIKDGFRAYQTGEAGALDYVSLLERRYPEALEAAQRGDSTGMVSALKQGGYFTGNEAQYTKSVARIASEILPNSDALAASRAAAPPPIAPEIMNFGSSESLGTSHGAPFVGALALSDEISRAALTLLAATPSDQDPRRDNDQRRKET